MGDSANGSVSDSSLSDASLSFPELPGIKVIKESHAKRIDEEKGESSDNEEVYSLRQEGIFNTSNMPRSDYWGSEMVLIGSAKQSETALHKFVTLKPQ